MMRSTCYSLMKRIQAITEDNKKINKTEKTKQKQTKKLSKKPETKNKNQMQVTKPETNKKQE